MATSSGHSDLKRHQSAGYLTSSAIFDPSEELGDAVDLIIVPAIGEGQDFGQEIVASGGFWRRQDLPCFDFAALDEEPGLVAPSARKAMGRTPCFLAHQERTIAHLGDGKPGSALAAQFDAVGHAERVRSVGDLDPNAAPCGGMYVIVETKGSGWWDDLRHKEGAKIKCGERHFAVLADGNNPTRYIKSTSVEDMLKHT